MNQQQQQAAPERPKCRFCKRRVYEYGGVLVHRLPCKPFGVGVVG